ncbi:MAG TPA: ATP-binding protein [Actinomycetes bacterium]|nr:ATP-binding protein [Actinomycetes bacterium]
MSDELLDSLRRAVEAAPGDVPLRLHLAAELVHAGLTTEAVSHLGIVLAGDPTSAEALELMGQALGTTQPSSSADRFSWSAAEADVAGIVEPMFVNSSPGERSEEAIPDPYDVVPSGVRLSDVGGLREVKERLDVAFLTPMRNPELRALYGKSLKGGLLLYGPPGCGKTFLAKAVAGELQAGFLHIGLSDVLDMWIGQSERNLHEIFEIARRRAPCVVFLDEIDALGQKRSQLRTSALRGTVNQLLAELDGVASDNEGVFVLAATNHPWDVDVALRRPGRLDRMLLVLPPDQEAREAILRSHLKDRPVAGVDIGKLARETDGFSGADLAHVCDTAAELALMDSARTGNVRMITMADLEAARGQIRPSVGAWLETARNVALFANSGGEYDPLLAYLKKRRLA